jgi:pilus assembly protein CpaE
VPFNGSKSEGRRSTMKVMLVGDPGEQRTQLKTVLATLVEPELEIIEGETATAANLSENVAAPPDATLVMVNGNEEAALNFLQGQALHSPRPSLLAVLTARSAGLMKRALRSGADEILFMPLDPGEATRALLKISEARWRTERREGGVVISVTSLIGGVGVTSLAGNLALALQSLHQRVALVDLDLQTGGLAVFLNLDPEVTIMPVVRLDRKLDSIQLESALTKHQSGVYLLAAPKRIEEGELVSDITVGTVLDLIRQLFDYRDRRLRRPCGRKRGRGVGALRAFVLRAQSVDRGRAIRMAIHRSVRAPGPDYARAALHSQSL